MLDEASAPDSVQGSKAIEPKVRRPASFGDVVAVAASSPWLQAARQQSAASAAIYV